MDDFDDDKGRAMIDRLSYIKHQKLCVTVTIFVILSCLMLTGCTTLRASEVAAEGAVYQERVVHSPDGIGKFYLGREIAQVMGHTAAGWLERPSRETEEQPNRVVNALKARC